MESSAENKEKAFRIMMRPSEPKKLKPTLSADQETKEYHDRIGYWEIREKKTKDQLSKLKDSDLFADMTIYFTGLKYYDGYKLGQLCWKHGAQVLPVLYRTRVTHVVSENLSGSKMQKELTMMSKSRIRVVHPQWILDCVEQKKRIPLTPKYLTLNPVLHGKTRLITDYFGQIKGKDTSSSHSKKEER